MPFPESPRILYDRNPLVEVICQFRFPEILRLETQPPVEFQEEIRAIYPKLKKRKEIKLSAESSTEGGKSRVAEGPTVFDFYSDDDEWKVVIGSAFLALVATNYQRWEEFRRRLLEVTDIFSDIYNVRSYSRVGLRYQNIIVRSNLDLEDVRWPELLDDRIIYPLKEKVAEDYLDAFVTVARYRLEVEESIAQLRHGLGVNEETGEEVYIIDSDFYTESTLESDNVFDNLDQYNVRARRLFRWCIRDRLHGAMGPRDPN